MESNEGGTVKVTTALRNEQAAYYRLCDEARALGIPTSLDDPRSPRTVDELRGAVARAALRPLTRKRAESDKAWRAAIRAAHAEGMSLRAIAACVGVAHTRVLQ